MLRSEYLLVMLAGLSLAGCAYTAPPPEIKSLYLGIGAPAPRPYTAQIDVFRQSGPPGSPYATIGELEVTTKRTDLSEREFLTYATEAARAMGGTAA
jgi:hypothetical protein